MSFQYSIVTACYNSEKYLDTYFRSIVRQSLDFIKNIQIICVDDGSTDSTVDKIKEWAKKYPENIQYTTQKNAGAGSARNAGIEIAVAPWIAFIDSDDFIHKKYFNNISKLLKQKENSQVRLLICYFINYFEETRSSDNKHPLNFRFQDKVLKFTLKSDTDFVHVNTTTSVFSREILLNNKLRFKEDVKPTFEDGELILRYMLSMEGYDIILNKQSKYYHRKRMNSFSLYAAALTDKNYYTSAIQNGIVRLLRETREKSGFIPAYMQQTCLYALRNILKRTELSGLDNLDHLEPGLDKVFFENISDAISYIDEATILKPCFKNSEPWLLVYFLEQCKGISFNQTIIRAILVNEKLLEISYLNSGERNPDFYINNSKVEILHKHRICHSALGKTLACTTNGSLKFNSFEDTLGASGQIFMVKEQCFVETISLAAIAALAAKGLAVPTKTLKDKVGAVLATSFFAQKQYFDAWVFIDSPNKAGGAAERMYARMQEKRPKIRCYYILKRSSSDWTRLKKRGFRLIPYASLRHTSALLYCAYLISSRRGASSDNYLSAMYRDFAGFKFIYIPEVEDVVIH